MLASYVFGGLSGLKLNFLTLLIIFMAEQVVRESSNELFSTTDPWLLLLVVASGLIAVAIIKYHETDQVALLRSQRQEMIQRERTLTLVNNLADGVLSTDRDGIITVYNAAALNLLDTNDSLNGQYIDDVVKLTDTTGEPVSLAKLLAKTKSSKVRDDLMLTFDEDQMRLEVTLSPIRRGYSGKNSHEDGYILILRDITKSKSLEEERDEFISVVSHELRTPITIAEGTISNAQILLDRGDIKPEILSQAVNSAHDQVMFLARMVNDLSTLSRAERGVADDMEVIDVKELAFNIYNNYLSEAEGKGLQLNIDTRGKLGQVFVSRLYLEELIQNFITNAIKYTHEGSITFAITAEKGEVEFAVKDTGIGISKSDQKNVFQKFYRAEDYRTRETSGTGLGLYVASKLARKLNTKIELQSRLNHGSRFSFKLSQVKNKKET
jgi:signal transduction histidine kinase